MSREVEEQLRALLYANRGLRKKQVELAERLDRMADDKPVKFAYAPSVASDVGRLGQTWISRVEAMVAQLHLNRDDPKDRATAAEAALRKWHQEDPKSAEELPSRTYTWSIEKFAPSGGRDTPSLRDGPPSPALDALPYGESYGSGGDGDLTADRIARLKAIAERRKWDLRNHSDRERAEAIAFAEDGRSVETARSFSEALHSYLRAHRLDFTEANRAQAARAVAEARSDLVADQYGRSAAIPSSSETGGRDAVKFNEKVLGILHDMGPERFDEDATARATREAVRRYPHLIPSGHYGSGRKKTR
jgi:hypothetical protein